jgi:anti-anti-sigma factor
MDITTLQFRDATCTVQPSCSGLVAGNAADFTDSLMPLSRQGMRLEVDLSGVRRVDSAGMGALLTCGQTLKRQGCQMVLTRVEDPVKAELHACGLDGFLASAPTPTPQQAW